MTDAIRPGIDFDLFEAYLQAVQASGRPPAMSSTVVVMFEDAGATVNSHTGMISWPAGIRAVPARDEGIVVVTEKA